MFAFLVRVESLADGIFSLDVADVVAGGDQVVLSFRGYGRRRDKVLDNRACLRVRRRDGRVVELWEFDRDLYAVDDFWS